jgi:transcriptional regulator with XRE-family HTH domain
MAKADLKKVETTFRADIGRVVAKARQSLGWSQKELVDAVELATAEHRDVAQVSRWESGTERPQFDVLWSVEALRGPLVIALASLSDQIDVVTEIRVRRPA